MLRMTLSINSPSRSDRLGGPVVWGELRNGFKWVYRATPNDALTTACARANAECRRSDFGTNFQSYMSHTFSIGAEGDANGRAHTKAAPAAGVNTGRDLRTDPLPQVSRRTERTILYVHVNAFPA